MHKQYTHLIPILIFTLSIAQLQANEKLFSHKDAYKILYYGDSASRTELAQSRPFTFTGFKVVAVIAQAEKPKMAQLRTALGTGRRINKEASKAQLKAGNVEIYINKSSYGEYHIYNQDRSISVCIHIQITISPDS